MSDESIELSCKRYLNKHLVKSDWHFVASPEGVVLFTHIKGYSIYDIMIKMRNMGLLYKITNSGNYLFRRVDIKTSDILNHIKAKEREDKINYILNE